MLKKAYLVAILLVFAVVANSFTALSHTTHVSEWDAKMTKYRQRVAKAFIDEKAKLPGTITLPSGLVIEIITRGEGTRAPAADDQCDVHYVGTLRDGTVFDSSRKRGEPATFRPNQVIPAWKEALQLMREGDKWRIYVPYNLGYGDHGAGKDIPPHTALEFEMELYRIKNGGKGRTSEEIDEIIEAAKKKKAEKSNDL